MFKFSAVTLVTVTRSIVTVLGARKITAGR